MNELSLDAAADLVACHWHIRGRVQALPSYLDQNFRIHSDAAEYVLKVAHPSWHRADLDLENHAMLALAQREPGRVWPRVVFTPDGEHLLPLPIAGQTCHVRLLRFVAGTTYAKAIGTVPVAQHDALNQSLGQTVGRLAHGLEGFAHPAADRAHPWNLRQLMDLEPVLAHVGERDLRQRLTRHMHVFGRQLPQWLRQLPQAVVHNDANDHNVIVAQGADGTWRVRSIIDFGDLCTSFRVADLAIACTYAMSYASEPVRCVHAMLRGYLAVCRLSADELRSLHAFIQARVCQSILMATRSRREQPDNDFVLISQQGMRDLLDTLAQIAPTTLVEPFLEDAA